MLKAALLSSVLSTQWHHPVINIPYELLQTNTTDPKQRKSSMVLHFFRPSPNFIAVLLSD